MTKKEKAARAVAALKGEYPDGLCSLDYADPLQLLIATRLSAQCTDARVNLVTPELFGKYKTAADFAAAEVEDIERIVHSCGFFRTKAADIVGMCRMIINEYSGEVPGSIEELTRLPGVGRKTANLVVGDIFGKPAVVTDTHVIRITNLLGLTDSTTPLKVETQLRKILDPAESNNFCHRCVLHGRAVCVARRPKCGKCVMAELCAHASSEK